MPVTLVAIALFTTAGCTTPSTDTGEPMPLSAATSSDLYPQELIGLGMDSAKSLLVVPESPGLVTLRISPPVVGGNPGPAPADESDADLVVLAACFVKGPDEKFSAVLAVAGEDELGAEARRGAEAGQFDYVLGRNCTDSVPKIPRP